MPYSFFFKRVSFFRNIEKYRLPNSVILWNGIKNSRYFGHFMNNINNKTPFFSGSSKKITYWNYSCCNKNITYCFPYLLIRLHSIGFQTKVNKHTLNTQLYNFWDENWWKHFLGDFMLLFERTYHLRHFISQVCSLQSLYVHYQ